MSGRFGGAVKKIAPFAFFVICICLGACQSLRAVLKEPLVSLASVEMADISFNGVDLICKVNVENPNPFNIPFPHIDWQFFINGDSFVTGALTDGVSIKSRGSTVVDVPVKLDYLELFNTFKSLKGSAQADYKIALGAKFPLPLIENKTWQFEHEGILPVPQMPKLSRPSMKIDKIDFSGVELLCSVDVENPNEFELPSPQIAYDYLVDNNSLIKSALETPAPIAAGAAVPVALRLAVSYEDVLRAAKSAAASGEVPALLSLKPDFKIPAFADETSPLDIAGVLPVVKAPVISFKGVSLKNLSISKIDLEIGWEVENPNSFIMAVKDLSYNFAVNNSQWASGKVPSAPQIGANRKTLIPLTFSVNNLAMVRTISELITKGSEIAYACGGSVDLAGNLPGLSNYADTFNFSGTTRLRK